MYLMCAAVLVVISANQLCIIFGFISLWQHLPSQHSRILLYCCPPTLNTVANLAPLWLLEWQFSLGVINHPISALLLHHDVVYSSSNLQSYLPSLLWRASVNQIHLNSDDHLIISLPNDLLIKHRKIRIKLWSGFCLGFGQSIHHKNNICVHAADVQLVISQLYYFANTCHMFLNIRPKGFTWISSIERRIWNSSHGKCLGLYQRPNVLSLSCGQPVLDSARCISKPLFPLIKLDAVGYLDMKDAHKKHISLAYGSLFCAILQVVWKSLWHLASKIFFTWIERNLKIYPLVYEIYEIMAILCKMVIDR